MNEEKIDMALGMLDTKTNEWHIAKEEYVKMQAFMRQNTFGEQEIFEEELRFHRCSKNDYLGNVPEAEK